MNTRSKTTSSALKKPLCTIQNVAKPVYPVAVTPDRQFLLMTLGKFWVSGTTLAYKFVGGPESQRLIVRAAFQYWHDHAAYGIVFKEVTTGPAQLRIGFVQGDGSWSYIGRDNLFIPQTDLTMNFGWTLEQRLNGPPDDTALHEIGHSLGFPHEHQSPNTGITWDEPLVLKTLAGPPNFWDEQTTRDNILDKLPINSVKGSSWDVDSIMEYPFEAGLILVPVKYKTQPLQPAGGLSVVDLKICRDLYPAVPVPTSPAELVIGSPRDIVLRAGQQMEFQITNPKTRYHDIETHGNADLVMVLFDGSGKQLKANDNGGQGRNAKITHRLYSVKVYRVRVRLYNLYGATTSSSAATISLNFTPQCD
jgi:hypothetical protein